MRLNQEISQHSHTVFKVQWLDDPILLPQRPNWNMQGKHFSPCFCTPVDPRVKYRYMESTDRSDLIKTAWEEEESKLICCNSMSKENTTSAPFYSRRMTCGGLCKDRSLACPCRLQQCTHAPKQNLQDLKAANSILGHLRPRGHCLWTGTSVLQSPSRWDSVRSKPRTWNQNSPVKAKSFCLNTSETESLWAQNHACDREI